jgi:hypothetical protein
MICSSVNRFAFIVRSRWRGLYLGSVLLTGGRSLGPRELAYVEGGGSGIETVSHLRENGRMVIMFCAFSGPPRIVRLHGRGSVMLPDHPQFPALLDRFPPAVTVRSIIRLDVERIADSCGYGVPKMQFVERRDDMERYLGKASDKAMKDYLVRANRESIDGLPGLSAAELEHVIIRREQ